MRIHALIILFSALLVGCATPRIAPRFTQPSTQPIAASNARAVSNVKAAKKQLQVITVSNPAIKLQLEDVSNRLDQALDDLGESEVARLKLEAELKAQTAKGNQLADNYDKLSAKVQNQDKIIAQDKKWLGIGRIFYGFVDLARHLLILAAAIVVLCLALWVLSFFFPMVGIALSVMFGFVRRIFTRNKSP